ncbi:MAG: hypothetical protein AAFR59_19780, partial [Bacteroidota bacterium]
MNIQQRFSFFLILAIVGFACTNQELEKVYVYEVNEVEVNQTGISKDNLKSDLEFLSLAYADLFGNTITEDQLNAMTIGYNALGDRTLIADIIVRNMLNDPEADVPTSQNMRADIDQFIADTYLKFYVREPGAYERWQLK